MTACITDPREFSERCRALRAKHETQPSTPARHAIGLVPTMGALHAGHISLVHEARRHATYVAVSIFVNPTQFAAGEDLDKYPRDLASDLAQCEAAGVDLVLAPDASSMYPAGDETRVSVSRLAEGLCGASRPGHFTGVCTVVAKLFNLAGPCVAIFGQKDYQQLKVIERLARDLWMPVQVIGAPILREADGLALSSRNRYLNPDERLRARALSAGIRAARSRFDAGERDVVRLQQACLSELDQAQAQVEYVEIVHDQSLLGLQSPAPEAHVLMAVAARIGKTRLIDNGRFDERPSGEGVA